MAENGNSFLAKDIIEFCSFPSCFSMEMIEGVDGSSSSARAIPDGYD